MAKPLLYIVTPHNNLFPHTYMLCYAHTRKVLKDKYEFGLSFCESSLVHINRNILFQKSLREGADYLMCIDSDIVWTPDDIEKLIAADKDVVSGIYANRQPVCNDPPTYTPCLYKRVPAGEYAVMMTIPQELCRVDASGMGFVLIRRRVVEKMVELIPELGYPFDFLPISEINGKDNGKTGLVGEDMCFFHRLHKAGFELWCEPSVQVGHLKTMAIYPTNYIKEV